MLETDHQGEFLLLIWKMKKGLTMANVNDVAIDSTPTSSRKASRARKAASTGTVRELPAREEPTQEVLPPEGQAASEAAPQAEGEVATTASGRAIPERQPSENTTENAAPAAPAEPVKLMVLAAKNPKRAGSKAANFFGFYYGADGHIHSTVQDAFARGVRGKDLSWDRQRGHVLIGEDVDAYLALQSDEERIAWIKSKGFDPKMAGFVIEVPAAEVEKVAEAVEGGEGQPVAEGEAQMEQAAA